MLERNPLLFQNEMPMNPTAEGQASEEVAEQVYSQELWPLPLDERDEHLASSTRLGYAVYDLTGEVQAQRAKENKIYQEVQTGERFFAKYVTQKETSLFDDVRGMTREKMLLDYLESTEVVPKTGVLRIYPNEQRARLLIEVLPGNSLDHPDLQQEQLRQGQWAESIIRSTAASLDRVHEAEVIVGDVNAGTFLIDTAQEGLPAKIVDLEIGRHRQDDAEELQALAEWCARTDKGLDQALQERSADDWTLLKQMEIYRWGRTMAGWLFGDATTWSDRIELPESYQQELSQVEAYVGPSLRQEVEERLRRIYRQNILPYYESGRTDETEEQFVQAELTEDYNRELGQVAHGVYFKAMVEQSNLGLSDEVVDFIAQALSVNPGERPSELAAIAGFEGYI